MATVFALNDGRLEMGLGETLRSGVRRLDGWRPSPEPATDDAGQPFVIGEINALIHYVTENGLDREGAVTGPLYQAVLRYHGLDAHRRGDEEGAACAAEILRLYTQLCALPGLEGISGRTLIYARSMTRHMRGLLLWGMLFVGLGAATEVLLLQNGTDGGAVIGLLRYLNPFFWGGVGASVYLVKALSDKAQALTFDRLRMQGLGSRIFLGAVLGALLVNSLGLDVGQGSFTAAGLAFLGGLGVKAIYAAFEALVDGFHDRIAPRGQPAPGR
jgi:hypothetical protein